MNFRVTDLGQFADVSVDFGDLTLLVGTQGTGKSIFLQLFKLSQDQDYVKNTMNQFGQDWDKRDRFSSPRATQAARLPPRQKTRKR